MIHPSRHTRLATTAMAAALITAAAAAGHRATPGPRPSSPAGANRPSSIVAAPGGQSPPRPAATEHRRRRERHPSARASIGRFTRASARASARVFLAAFLAYERGHRTRTATGALERTATPALARSLLAAPPRRPPGRAWPPPARVRRLTVIGPSAGRLKALAVLDRDGRRSVLELHLRRSGGRWHVAELG
jgi:hypothetical protein